MRSLLLVGILCCLALVGCDTGKELPDAGATAADTDWLSPTYKIGPGDVLQVFVWQNEDLTGDVAVRPDGRITMPLIEDLPAAGKTPSELGRDIEAALDEYIIAPVVTVMVSGFAGTFDQQVRVVGAAQQPAALPFRANMTVLDVMISVGGLTEFAAGNRATLVRFAEGERTQYRLRLDDLVREGDITANAAVLPGDVIIIPTAIF